MESALSSGDQTTFLSELANLQQDWLDPDQRPQAKTKIKYHGTITMIVRGYKKEFESKHNVKLS
jgi:hypothetical protein